jgi:hypothetical protein
MIQCCYIVMCKEILEQNWLVCWSIVVKEKPIAGSPFFGAFPSDRILKAMNDVSVHFFPHAAIPVNYTRELRVIFEVTTCKDTRCVFVINKTRTIFRHFQSLVVSLVHQACRSCSVSKQVRVKGTLRLRVSQFRPGVESLLGLMARLNTTNFQFGVPRLTRIRV